MGIGNLPDGWEWSTLGETTNPSQKRVNPQNFPDLPYIGMENVESQTMRLLGTVPAKEMRSAADSFSPDDVLYGRLRPYLNKVYRPEFEGLCSTEFIIFRKVPHINSKFLQYFLNSWDFMNFANSLNAGDRPRVKFEQLADYPFPLAPLPEQERIVSRIEELFSDLEAGVAALERVRAGLKRYKASVLKAAVEGRLVNGKLGIGEAELPEGWQSVIFSSVIERVKRGPSMKCNQEGLGIRYITSGNLEDGQVRLDYDYKFLDGFDRIQSCKLIPGDLILNCVNSLEQIGKSAVFKESHGNAIVGFNNYGLELRQNLIMPEFANIVCQSHQFKNQLYYLIKRAVNQVSFATRELDFLNIPLPPLEEQRRIVAEVERRLSVVGEVESTVEAGLARSARLRQAVLRSAFEGRLA